MKVEIVWGPWEALGDVGEIRHEHRYPSSVKIGEVIYKTDNSCFLFCGKKLQTYGEMRQVGKPSTTHAVYSSDGLEVGNVGGETATELLEEDIRIAILNAASAKKSTGEETIKGK